MNLQKIDRLIIIFSVIFALSIPFLVPLIYPEILTSGLETYWYILYWGGSILFIVGAAIAFLIGKKYLTQNSSSIGILSKKIRSLIYPWGIITILLGCAASTYLIYVQLDLSINSYRAEGIYLANPKMGAPIFQEPGKNVTLEFAGDELDENVLINATMLSYNIQIQIDATRISQNQINITIPSNCNSSLYSLKLKLGEITLYEPYVIRVWGSEESNPNRIFRIAHINDLHISPGENDQYSDWLQTTINTLAIVNPDLVLLIGDLTNSGKIAQYQALKDLIIQFGKFGIAIMMVIGNHDTYAKQYNSLEYWYRSFAPEHYTRDIPGQNLRIISFNTGARGSSFNLENEMEFIENNLKSKTPLQEVILACHIPPYRFCEWAMYDTQEKEFTDLCDQYHVEAVLAGHSHADRVVAKRSIYSSDLLGGCSTDYPLLTPPFNETAYIETVGRDHNPAFRWINLNQGQIVNCTYDADGDDILDQKSSVSLKNSTLRTPWMQYQDSNTWKITIENNLNMVLWVAHAFVELPDTANFQNWKIVVNEYYRNVNSSDAQNILRTYSGNVASFISSETCRLGILSFDIGANRTVIISLTAI